MVRLGVLALGLILVLQVRGMAAADLIHKIPVNDPARAELRVLDRYGLLSSSRAGLFNKNTELLLTRYDIAYALIEPMRLFIALATPTDALNNSSEQRRLHEQAARDISGLSRDEMIRLLDSANHLLTGFTDVIEELAPGLTTQAKDALDGIRGYVLKGTTLGRGDPRVILHISLDPNVEPDPMGNPLPLLPLHHNDLVSTMVSGGASPESVKPISRPVNVMEAAMNLAIGRFQLSSKLSTLPGLDPSLLVIRPDQLSGSAMFRLQYNIGKINDLSIAGIVEYHILRSYEEPGIANTSTGAVGGVSILW